MKVLLFIFFSLNLFSEATKPEPKKEKSKKEISTPDKPSETKKNKKESESGK